MTKKEYDRLRYLEKKEHIKKITREYKKNNPEVNAKHQRTYYWKNRDNVLSKKREIDKTDEQRKKNLKYYYDNRISKVMASRIRSCINKKGKSWIEFVNYTIDQLKSHLESKFEDGMSWENYGEWEIDHIKPISKFNITSFDCVDFKKCWSLNNLQPLWAINNRKKYTKEIMI